MKEKVLLIDGIINYAGNVDKAGLLMFIDFEKAFDSMEWERALTLLKILSPL